MNNLEHFKDNLASQRILIVGDVMVDTYMWGDVSRISPEAPVPIVSINRHEKRLGGAANVALNIRSLGAMPVICTVLGKDDNATDFQQIMYNHDMDKRGIICSDDRITTVKTRVIGNMMHIVRVDEEVTTPLSGSDEDSLIERIERIFKTLPINAIILGFRGSAGGTEVLRQSALAAVRTGPHIVFRNGTGKHAEHKHKNHGPYKDFIKFLAHHDHLSV